MRAYAPAAFLTALLLLPVAASACTPPVPKPLEVRVAEADLIVTATAGEEKVVSKKMGTFDTTWTTEFTVKNMHKGPDVENVVVFSRAYATCEGAHFTEGETYTMLLSIDDASHRVSAGLFSGVVSKNDMTAFEQLEQTQPELFEYSGPQDLSIRKFAKMLENIRLFASHVPAFAGHLLDELFWVLFVRS